MTALVELQLILVCCQDPCSTSQHMASISKWPRPRQNFLPHAGSRETSESVPRWALSCSATTAPKKVIHTNNQRDNSSETVIPVLNA